MRLSQSISILFGVAAVSAGSTPALHFRHYTDKATKGDCAAACAELANRFPQPGQTLTRNTSAYHDFTQTYWNAEQQDASPRCIFVPANADEVAFLIRLATSTSCPFAVKSGGHGAFANSSSIQDGITISLAKLNEISVSDDKTTVTIGTGNNWLSVYQTLEKHDLAVPGGRYPTVGVGGLSLGGGISFFSSARGWECDNILSHELVTAQGEVIQVDNTPGGHPDLHWALRGGGNNFGIVTKITMQAFELKDGLMFGGMRFHNLTNDNNSSTAAALVKASYNLGTTGTAIDPLAGQILNFGIVLGGQKIAISTLSHPTPVDTPPPAVFSEFLAIHADLGTAKVRTLTNLSLELQSPSGLGAPSPDEEKGLRSRGTATFRLNEEIMTYAKDVCFEEFEKVKRVSGMASTCTFQIITKEQLEVSASKGGNVLGLEVDDGPLFLVNIVQSWEGEDGVVDASVREGTRRIIERTTEYGEKMGWSLGYRYMNYAGEFQDVVKGYGAKNQKRLVKIAKKYDPRGVFQRLLPGGFKLSGAPAGHV